MGKSVILWRNLVTGSSSQQAGSHYEAVTKIDRVGEPPLAGDHGGPRPKICRLTWRLATWYPEIVGVDVDSSEQPLRILIVDADAFFRRGVREIVNEADGIQVVGEAADGEQAIQVARELRPDQLDLVLIDVDLPRLDGISAATQPIRDDPELAVVMLTLSTQDRALV